jgi:hypothetical protein
VYACAAADNEGVISPTDLTLLDALMNGATALSLKVGNKCYFCLALDILLNC